MVECPCSAVGSWCRLGLHPARQYRSVASPLQRLAYEALDGSHNIWRFVFNIGSSVLVLRHRWSSVNSYSFPALWTSISFWYDPDIHIFILYLLTHFLFLQSYHHHQYRSLIFFLSVSSIFLLSLSSSSCLHSYYYFSSIYHCSYFSYSYSSSWPCSPFLNIMTILTSFFFILRQT